MAQKLVKEREGVALSDDEAAFIALHIINFVQPLQQTAYDYRKRIWRL